MTLRIGHWALVAATLAAGGLIAPIPRSPVSVGIHSSQPAAQVAHIQVPVLSSAFYTGSLGIADGEIVVGDLTSRTVCQIAIVNPISWRVISNRETSCTNPALDGQSIMPVESVAPKSTIGLVRIATTTRVAGAVHLGPVVMRYENDSASLPEWTYGGGYLWLYDTALSTGVASIRRSPEVLRIDESTGQVSATITVPSLPLVELAADADGLWMARSEDTSWSGSKPPALLYFVGTRSRYPKVVVKNGDYVTWLAAAGHQRVGERSSVRTTLAPRSPIPSTGPPPSLTLSPSGRRRLCRSRPDKNHSTDSRSLSTPTAACSSSRRNTHGSSTSNVTKVQIFEFNPSKGTESKIASLQHGERNRSGKCRVRGCAVPAHRGPEFVRDLVPSTPVTIDPGGWGRQKAREPTDIRIWVRFQPSLRSPFLASRPAPRRRCPACRSTNRKIRLRSNRIRSSRTIPTRCSPDSGCFGIAGVESTGTIR